MNFEEYWNRYGELHASMCNGKIKLFASEIWKSAMCEANACPQLADVRALQCCGNCYYYDVIIDKGGVCNAGGEEMSCDREGWCEDWVFLKI